MASVIARAVSGESTGSERMAGVLCRTPCSLRRLVGALVAVKWDCSSSDKQLWEINLTSCLNKSSVRLNEVMGVALSLYLRFLSLVWRR